MVHLPFLIFTLENPEWLIILVIVVILFGGSRLGQLGSSLGQGIREFKKATREESDAAPESQPAATAEPRSAPTVTPVIRSAAPAPPKLGDYLPPSERRDEPARHAPL